MKRIVITGVSGFLGSHLAMGLRNHFRVFGLYMKNRPNIPGVQIFQCDLVKQKQVTQTLMGLRPDVVIHTAAFTDVTFCTQHPRFAENFNVGVIGNLVPKQALRYQFIHISCAGIFGGNSGSEFLEEASPVPPNHYAVTKRRAEEVVFMNMPNAVILRLGRLYGLRTLLRSGFTESWNRKLESKKEYTFVADHYYSPLLVDEVAPVVRLMIENDTGGQVYHVSSQDRVSDYSMLLTYGKLLGLSTAAIRPVAMETVAEMRQLGKDVSINPTKLGRDLGYRTLSVKAGLERLFESMKTGEFIEKEIAVLKTESFSAVNS